MRIESLHIEEFGAIRHLHIDLHPMIHVIEGENESGKTTVAAFIRYMLYGFSGKGDAANAERQRRLTVEDRRVLGSMTLTCGAKHYRIERSTTAILQNGRESFRDECALFDAESGLPVKITESSVGEFLLGVPEHVYTSTAFLSDMADIRVGGADMREAVEQILFSGSEKINVQQSLDKLDAARRALLHKNGKGGDIFELEKQADGLKAALSASHEASCKAAALEADLTRAHEERAEAMENLTKLKELDTAYRHLSVIREYDALHAMEAETDRCDEAIRSFRAEHSEKDFFPDADYLTELAVNRSLVSEAAKQYSAAQKRAQNLRDASVLSPQSETYICEIKTAGGFAAIRKNIAALSRRATCSHMTSALLFLLAAVFFLTGLAQMERNFPLTVAAWLLTAAALGATVMLFVTARHHANALLILCRHYGTKSKHGLLDRLLELESETKRKETHDSQLQANQRTIDDCLTRCEEAVDQLKSAAAKWGRLIDTTDVIASLDELTADVKACINENDRLHKRREEVRLEVARIRAKLEGYSEVTVRTLVSPAKRKNLQTLEAEGRISEINRGILLYNGKIDALDRRTHDLELACAGESARIGEPDLLAADLDALQARIASLRARHQAYLKAGEVISGAGEALRNRIAPRLTEYARRLMSEVTSGTHNTLGVTANLGLTVSDEYGTHNILRLSGATTDDAYIALRLSLISLLFREAPPICYDESFAHQDDDRIVVLLSALLAIGEEDDRQQLIFTCHAREAQVLQNAGVDHGHLILEAH